MSAKPTFTPGPWEWRGYYLQEVGYDNPYDTPNQGPVWDDGSAGGEYRGFDTSSANAHLIATAPELYGLLARAYRHIPKDHELRAQIRQILAKARGESAGTTEDKP